MTVMFWWMCVLILSTSCWWVSPEYGLDYPTPTAPQQRHRRKSALSTFSHPRWPCTSAVGRRTCMGRCMYRWFSAIYLLIETQVSYKYNVCNPSFALANPFFVFSTRKAFQFGHEICDLRHLGQHSLGEPVLNLQFLRCCDISMWWWFMNL